MIEIIKNMRAWKIFMVAMLLFSFSNLSMQLKASEYYPEPLYEIHKISFADAKLIAEQIGNPAVDMLMEKLEKIGIDDEQIAYLVISSKNGKPLNCFLGIWFTKGTGYGFPSGPHFVGFKDKMNIFVWYYPDDSNATTIILPLMPIPFICHGPQAGGVIAVPMSFFDAPVLSEGPRWVIWNG